MSELRKDLITGRWVIVTSPKGKRAEDFRCEIPYERSAPECPFCPGNEPLTPAEITALRPQGSRPNEPGWQIRVIPNQYPVLKIEQELVKKGKGIYDQISGFGAHEIVIDSPDHHKIIKDMSEEEIHRILVILQSRIEDLYKDQRLRSVLICKNEGPLAGAHFTHPHHQIIAAPIIPQYLKEHLKGAENYYRTKERCIYCDILREERQVGERIVYENDHFLVYCPYASRFPFEMWVLPKMHDPNFFGSRNQSYALAQAVRISLYRLAQALGNPQFNYVIYSAPNTMTRHDYWATLNEDFHWHMEIMPCLAKALSFDRGTGLPINPTSPEAAAKFLRDIPVFV